MSRVETPRVLIAGMVLAAACTGGEPGSPVPSPPPTRAQDIVELLHGVDVPDPYRWLEDQKAPETRAWIDSQNSHTDAVLTRLAGRDDLRALAARVLERDTIGLPDERGGRYFFSKRRADQDLSVIYVREGLVGDDEVLIGTLSYSDPETGSHFWYPFSSSAERVEGGWKVNKKSSWTTSGGFADWYVIQTTSPDFDGDYSDLSVFLIMADEISADPSTWDGLGLRGNQSGPLQVEDRTIPEGRLIGPTGDGASSNDEAVDPFFLACSSSCWNGISMGLIDIAKGHTTKKKHVDVGMRVCDYPTIQDYIGEAVIDTNTSRAFVYQLTAAMDKKTNDCDWSIHEDVAVLPRSTVLHWMWQVKFTAAKNVAKVADKMLHACGGTGYKPGLGIERYLRDGKAGWVMGPTNEVLRQFVGKAVLLGFDSLDYWNQSVNERVLHNEIKKMDAAAKSVLAQKLLAEAEESQ